MGTITSRPSPVSMNVCERVRSSTRPVSSSIVTESPIRIGCEIASRIPASGLARIFWAAKPSTRPSTALEASTALASLSNLSNWLSAIPRPTTMIATKTSRRTIRSRVFAARETVASLTLEATRVARPITNRSTMKAIAKAIRSVIAAEIQSPLESQKVSSMPTILPVLIG